MIRLGDRIAVRPVTFDAGETPDGKKKTATGRVVYIHPRGRYCTLEFKVGAREPVKLRESFRLVDGEVFQ